MTILTKEQRILRNEANEFDSEGLGSKLESFLSNGDRQDGEEPKDAIESEVKPKIDPNANPEEGSLEASEAEKKVEVKLDDGEEEEEEDLPGLGDKKPAEESEESEESEGSEFDEKKFDEQTEAETKDMEPKAANKWKNLKSELKEARKAVEEAKSSTSESKPSAEVEAELADLRQKAEESEGLRKRNEELLKVNDKVAIEESTEYLDKVRKPFSEMESILKDLSGHSKIPTDELIAIVMEEDIGKQDSMLEALESRMSTRMVGRIGRIADDYKQVNEVKKDLLANASKTLETSRINSQKAATEDALRKTQAFKASTEESFASYAGRIPTFTDSSGSLTELAKSVMAKTASMDPSTFDSSDLGYMAFATNALPAARKAIVDLQKEIKALKVGSSSGSKGIDGSPSTSTTNDDGEEKGLRESMEGIDFTFTAP
tara:strand:- start:2610 stop:3905 length:1296 start_codon:yes stop_codon:yes gene_type:complete